MGSSLCQEDTLQGINISHLGKRKIIFKMPFLGDMLVPWRVLHLIRVFPKMVGFPNNHRKFPTKNDQHLGVCLGVPSLKPTFLPLKMDGKGRLLALKMDSLFSGATVSFREGTSYIPSPPLSCRTNSPKSECKLSRITYHTVTGPML